MRQDGKDEYDSLDFTKREEESRDRNKDGRYKRKGVSKSITLQGAKCLCLVGAKGIRKNLRKRGWKWGSEWDQERICVLSERG